MRAVCSDRHGHADPVIEDSAPPHRRHVARMSFSNHPVCTCIALTTTYTPTITEMPIPRTYPSLPATRVRRWTTPAPMPPAIAIASNPTRSIEPCLKTSHNVLFICTAQAPFSGMFRMRPEGGPWAAACSRYLKQRMTHKAIPAMRQTAKTTLMASAPRVRRAFHLPPIPGLTRLSLTRNVIHCSTHRCCT